MNNSKPNVYHILFDGFNSLVFLKALHDLNAAENFNGFTFFKKNRANYDDTFASNTSLRSGSFYSGGPFRLWDNVQHNPGIFQKINRYEYQLNQYTDNKNISYKNAVRLKVNDDLLDQYTAATYRSRKNLNGKNLSDKILTDIKFNRKILKTYNHITKYTLSERIGKGTRLALSKCIKPFNMWLKSNHGFPSFSMDRYILSDFVLSLPMMLDFINNEKEKPASGQYNLAHIMLPHSPFNWTRALESSDSNYAEQVYCTINLMRLLIDELKRLDRFNNSLIIFHSDHGWSDVDFDYPYLNEIPKKLLDKIERTINHPPSRFLHRSHALLLIKPPYTNDTRLFETSDRLTQLVDIPSTLAHLLGWDIRTPKGRSVFSDTLNPEREVHMFSGLHKYNWLGLKCDFGKHFLKGNLANLSINQNDEWKIYPDVPASWN